MNVDEQGATWALPKKGNECTESTALRSMGAGEGGTALLLTLMESRLGLVNGSGPIVPIGAQAPTGLLVLLSEALGGVGCGPASEHQLLGFSSL